MKDLSTRHTDDVRINMEFYKKTIWWIISTIFLLKGVITECNVNYCDLEYCSGDGCILCIDGYYLSGVSCYPCRSNCVKCTGYSTCSECVKGKHGTTCESDCRNTCPDCTSSSLCTECIPGRYGSYCQQLCPQSCLGILCNKDTSKCSLGCRHGYYKSGEECTKCPEHCTRCTDSVHCTDCDRGYYGTYCQNACPSSCKNQECDKSLGYCNEGCIERYFQDGNECHDCPYTCTTCVDQNTCGDCKTGYWGSQCQNDCPITCNKCTTDGQCLQDIDCDVSNCNTDYCLDISCIKCKDGYYLSGFYCYQCPSYCTKCTGSSTCTECDYGRYGTKCDYTCRKECPDCVSSTQCTICIPGRYGPYCQYYSPLSCIDIISDKTSGKCALGCRHGYYTSGEDCNQCPEYCERCSDNSHCSICMTGYYGTYCQNMCPSSCRNELCDKDLGQCTGGCIEGYYLEQDNCLSCPHKCVSCEDLNRCTNCKTGYWGPTCEKDCPEICYKCSQDGQCISDIDCDVNNCDTDYCLDISCIKCKDGYYLSGFYCNQCPSYCTKCTGSSTCTECDYGRYGTKCDYTCRKECPDCVSSTQCTICIPGRYGPYCQYYSPLSCIDILSEKTSGKCTLGCRHGYYKSGDDCNQCPEHCERCSDNSHCSICMTGYYGTYCQNMCPSSCRNELCDKDLGRCTGGCIEGYYLEQDNCLSCPHKCVSCEDLNNCTECKTGFWGSICEKDCPETCFKCSQDGQCISDIDCDVSNCDTEYCLDISCIKCKDGYYLSGFNCYQCPSYCTKCTGSSTCTECDYGRYGTKCEYTCRKECPDCVSSTQCTICIPGRYGPYCQYYSPLSCIDILSDKTSGKCALGCRHGYYKSGVDCNHCPERCERCSDNSHCSICMTGYYGTYCQNMCPSSCSNRLCDKELGRCTGGCIEGYYLEQDNCLSCPHKCVSCEDLNRCTECKTGYWGPTCEKDCPETCYKCSQEGQCISGTDCDISNCDREYCWENSCIKCRDGYYLSGAYCYQCPSHCIKCSGSSVCTECEYGRYGTKCEYTCRAECPDCVSSTLCTECMPGRHGSYCQLYCSLACMDILCDKGSGKCTLGCRHGYYKSGEECVQCQEHCTRCSNSTVCTACSSGYYGTYCQNACPPSCKNQDCDRELGTCLDGCIEGYFSEEDSCLKCPNKCRGCSDVNTCTECKTGYWGQQCQNDCPLNCMKCTTKDGQCISDYNCDISNCDREYCYGSSCIKCMDGYYLSGSYCYQCRSDCTTCTGSSTCNGCVRGKYGPKCEHSCSDRCIDCVSSSQCTQCIPGRHGSYCQSLCPLGCIDILCDKDSSKCTRGCRHGYYLNEDECDMCSEHCTKCTANNQCTACVPGYYGSLCQNTCHQGCVNELCEKDSGKCIEGCIKGYYPDENNCVTCPNRCVSCANEYNCTQCQAGFWGPQCQYDCPNNCSECNVQGECIDDGGAECNIDHCQRAYCSESSCIQCEHGYYLSGTSCYKCRQYCTKCSDSSFCSECVRGNYGPQCDYSCSTLCPDCLSSSQCTECIPGRYGSACQSYCPLSCNKILCDKSTGKCTDGCRYGYYYSEADCKICPENCARCANVSVCTMCTPGYFGTYCQKTCPQGCKDKLCHKNTGHCTAGCIRGFYYNDDCTECRETCVSCVAAHNCTECKAGYWGSECQHHCPGTCNRCTLLGQCIEDQGNECDIVHCDRAYCSGSGCIKCEDGYYLSGTNCYRCPSTCLKCTGSSTCTECVTGQYGTTCGLTCRSTCTDCVSSTQCKVCIPGRHGSACELPCPLSCKAILCDKNSGKCTEGCNNGYYSSGEECYDCPNQCTRCLDNSFCTSCSPGFYGSQCQMTCPAGCRNQLCDADSGNCTEGCANGYHFNLGYCVEDLEPTECQVDNCIIGHCFGNACTNCKNGYYVGELNCYKCPDHCIRCSTGSQCEECVPGRHGSVCQFQCSLGCKASICSNDGFCTEGCNEGYTMTGGECQSCPTHCLSCNSMDSCSNCAVGYWGPLCQYDCVVCNGIECGQEMDCLNGCIAGYYEHIIGEERYECAKCPQYCQKCRNSDNCSTCKAGYWGNNCQSLCNSNCNGNKCNQVNGYCTDGCKREYYGNACSKKCSHVCETCENGDSCITCATGRYGVTCEQDCSVNCFRYACFRNNGTCVYGCSSGYSGNTCSKEQDTRSEGLQEGSNNGAAIGLGIVLAIAVIVIIVLVVFLLRERQSRKQADGPFRDPGTVMNQTYETQIGTTDLKDFDRQHYQGEDNLDIGIDADDQGHSDDSHGNSPHTNPYYSDIKSGEEGEYSVI